MNKKSQIPSTNVGIRQRAEERLENSRLKIEHPKTEADTHHLLHELHVHQIELEMQNEELRLARNEMEDLLEKYTDLYDFAPVGYFSLNAAGVILEANLTAATLLGVEREKLIGQRLPNFATPESRPVFKSFLEQVFAAPERKSCEAIFVKADKTAFWAVCHGTSAFYTNTQHDWCRMVVSDITAQREAEETQRNLNAMSVANQSLKKEIEQRKAVEEELRQSALQNRILLEQSNHLHEQLRSLSHRLLTVQEEERKRISRDLHDEITQTLVGINVHLESLAQEAKAKQEGLWKKIAGTQKLVAQSVEIVHRFAEQLRPPVLDDLGLIPVMESTLGKFMKDTGIQVALTAGSEVEQLDAEHRTALYRIAQEALANIAQHANAGRVDVTLQLRMNEVHMQIKDDGDSFEVDRILDSATNIPLGLLGMHERMEMVGGSLDIVSKPGSGTTIHAAVPLKTDPKDNSRP